MVTSVDQELVLQVLRRMEVLAGRLLTITPTLHKNNNVSKILIRDYITQIIV